MPFLATLDSGDYVIKSDNSIVPGPRAIALESGDQLFTSGATRLDLKDGHTLSFPSLSTIHAWSMAARPLPLPNWSDDYVELDSGRVHGEGAASATRIRIRTSHGTLALYGSSFTVSEDGKETVVWIFSANLSAGVPTFYDLQGTPHAVEADGMPHRFGSESKPGAGA